MRLMNHACIIKLIEIIENQSNKYIVTELLSDGDLFDYILEKHKLTGTSNYFIDLYRERSSPNNELIN